MAASGLLDSTIIAMSTGAGTGQRLAFGLSHGRAPELVATLAGDAGEAFGTPSRAGFRLLEVECGGR